jgi:Fe2+ or Zn2+ uptake regulation protein
MKPKEKSEKDPRKLLNTAGLKNTAPRIAILEVLFKTKQPETVQDIYKKLKNIDLVTLYRTLDSFEKSQLVRQIDLHKDAVYYELNREHHHHIVCTRCGTVEDFRLCNMNLFIKKIVEKSSNFKMVNEHSLELFGMCKACATS